jgi:hypothetical protein
MHRIVLASLAMILPLGCFGADDSRPQCSSHNQGRLWPEAANHDSKLMSHLMRCGELFICVRGVWHYHWEAPSIRLDQLARNKRSKAAKPTVCAEQSAAIISQPAAPDAKSFR